MQQITGIIQSKYSKHQVQEHEESNDDNQNEIEAVDIWKQFDCQVKLNYTLFCTYLLTYLFTYLFIYFLNFFCYADAIIC